MDIERLRELSDAATPGPWSRVTVPAEDHRWQRLGAAVEGSWYAVSKRPGFSLDQTVAHLGVVWASGRDATNADFVAAAVNYVRELLDPIEPISPERLARYVG